jgi:hypothetical protein
MSFDPVTESEIIEWHRVHGGAGKRAAGHALRILRECVELCVAAGANEKEIAGAVLRELNKAQANEEFTKIHTHNEISEEFVDVKILATVFRYYFIPTPTLEYWMRHKLDVCNGRAWEADADGVLWRPGTGPAGTPSDGGESS